MANQTKFITSHRSRVKRANEARARSPEKISIFDREAYVEFYLLEDIVRLYKYRLEREQKKVVETRPGRIAKERNIRKFMAIINVFTAAAEIAWGEIDSGNYSLVWKSIPESALMLAANSVKHLPRLCSIGTALLKVLSDESLSAEQSVVEFDEAMDRLEDHEANVRTVKGLPSPAEVEAIIREANSVIAEAEAFGKSKTRVDPISKISDNV